MSHFGLKISKSESPDKTPYTTYYPHNLPHTSRRWEQPYIQFGSVDPATKNYAVRIERRYHNGWITPVVFDKTSLKTIDQEGATTICTTYKTLTEFLEKYIKFFHDCHFIIIERQLPQNYKATRIAQHTISYLSVKLFNTALLPSIIEVDPKLKGKILGAPKGITDKQLKSWAVEEGRRLFTTRLDQFSLNVLNHFSTKQDDLCDAACQIEAICICWGIPATAPPPSIEPNKVPLLTIKPITLEFQAPNTIEELPSLQITNTILAKSPNKTANNQQLSEFMTNIPTRQIQPVQQTQPILQTQRILLPITQITPVTLSISQTSTPVLSQPIVLNNKQPAKLIIRLNNS